MPHAVITGGADGIGRALAEHYANAGYAITIIDRDAERAEAVCRALQPHEIRLVQADLRSGSALRQVLATLQTLPPADIVIHSAGISAVGRFAESDMEQQHAVLDINLRVPLQLTAGLLRDGLLAQGGTLVFIASLSVFMSYPGAVVYAASKDGIAAYARSLRVALLQRGLHVLTVYPGPTRTAHARRYSPDNRREARRMLPGRLAELIAAAVQQRQAVLVPGLGNRFAAILGRVFPLLAEYLMRRSILEKLPPAGLYERAE